MFWAFCFFLRWSSASSCFQYAIYSTDSAGGISSNKILGKDDQVLDIYNPIAPRHRANITQWLVHAPVVSHYAHVSSINNAVSIQVDDRFYWRLPQVLVSDPTGLTGA
jgi:hypothetical protein